MKRWQGRVLAWTMGMGAAGVLMAGVEPAGERAPNIVLIISDDQAWTDYGFMGHPAVRTPHLDRLAGESLTFTRGYVPASLCRPSLASMVTGLFPHQHRITGNDPAPPAGFEGRWMGSAERHEANRAYVARMAGLPTLPRLLGARGYVSHQSGKWWEGEYAVGGFSEGMTHGDPARGGRHGDAGLTIGRSGMEPVLGFIDRAVGEGKPFFIWYAPFLPHTPHNPPERLLARHEAPDRPIQLARYYAMIEWFDETCGELLGHLDARELRENTVVAYVCDNGWIQATPAMELPEGWTREGYAPRSKRSPHEGGIRTPILLRWPGRIEPRRDEENLAHSVDLMPTLLAAAGVEVPAGLPGINLMDRSAVVGRRMVTGDVYAHDMPGPIEEPLAGLQHRWVVAGDWKLIVPNPHRLPGAGVELYHLAVDPHETRNLAGEETVRVERLRRRLEAWLPVNPGS